MSWRLTKPPASKTKTNSWRQGDSEFLGYTR